MPKTISRRSKRKSPDVSVTATTALVGVAYFLIGWSFALPTTHAQAWRYAFWVGSALLYVGQIAYEHYVRRRAPLLVARHAGLASAIGGFGLAVAGMVHDLVTRSEIRPLFFVALVAWPLLTGIPAFVGAWVAALILGRRHRDIRPEGGARSAAGDQA